MENNKDMYRGSRKHILDWTNQPEFCVELLNLIVPVDARVTARSLWMPRGHKAPEEARLETFGIKVIPDEKIWRELSHWWLVHQEGATTPNWDLAFGAEIEGKHGLILVEAKANVPELSIAGKTLSPKASQRSLDNHARIDKAVKEACRGLNSICPGIGISRDSHYQLSNRVAFLWKLASLGVPTVLIYLGFYGDEGIADVGEPFRDAVHWSNAFAEYSRSVLPEEFLNCRIQIGDVPAWLLVRSREVIEPSKLGVASRNRKP